MSKALQELTTLEKEAMDFGFNWPNQNMILDQIIDECREVREDISNNEPMEKIQEEIGDLLHAALSLCIFSGFEVEDTISKVYQKFDKRFQVLKLLTQQQGLPNLEGQSIEFMLELWQQAKILTKEGK